jgi:hypothetical protein
MRGGPDVGRDEIAFSSFLDLTGLILAWFG